MTTRAEKSAIAADERVASWASLSPADRADLLASSDYQPLLSGGAMASINGVDRWFPSLRHALDELAARRLHRP